MTRIFKYSFVLAAAAAMFVSCERKEKNATLRVTPQHHSRNIDSCMIYFKYNTHDKPTGPYDDSARCVSVNGKPVATFTNLKPGKYYLFGFGWDANGPYAVKGGAPYSISEEGTFDYILAVSEE